MNTTHPSNFEAGPGPENGPAPDATTRDSRAADTRAMDLRRSDRVDGLARLRAFNLEVAEALTNVVVGRAAEDRAAIFARVADPCLSMARISKAYRDLTVEEEKMDVTAETRAARIKAEAEAGEKAARAATEAEAYDARRNAVRRAVRDIHVDAYPDMGRAERAAALEDAFAEYEDDIDFDGYEDDPAEIVAELCDDLGLKPVPPAAEDAAPAADEKTPSDDKAGQEIAARKRARDLAIGIARDYLDRPASGAPSRTNGHDPPG